jgi:hypothetical protein
MSADPKDSPPMFSSIRGYYDLLNNYMHGTACAFFFGAATMYLAPKVLPYIPDGGYISSEGKLILLGGIGGAAGKLLCAKMGM